MKCQRRSERGLSQLGMLLTVLIIVCVGYVGVQVVPFYIYFFEIEGHFDAQAEKAIMKTDEEMREFLSQQIRRMNLPVDPSDLIIRRRGSTIIIELEYYETLVLDLGEDYYWELWTFEFHPRVEKKIM